MLWILLFVAVLVYAVLPAIYNITFHPLARFPGPKLHAAFHFPCVYYIIRGRWPYRIKELHDQYGPVVRIAPRELSFTSAQAWHDIYGAKRPQNPKNFLSYTCPDDYEGMRMVMEHSDAKHHASRQQISHAFTPKALLELQPIINGYVDQMIDLLRGHAKSNTAADLCAHFNWLTFDITGYLTFGESFHCLDKASTHPWIQVVFDGVAAGHIINQWARYGSLKMLLALLPKAVKKPREDMIALNNALMDARIEKGFGPDMPRDFAYYMRYGPNPKKEDENSTTAPVVKTSRDVMCANGESLIIAGSETTATHLTSLTFLLLTMRPDYLKRMKDEIRSAFHGDSLEEVNYKTVTEKLPLMIAAVKEALRFYPPVPVALARQIVDHAKPVDGNLIPINTAVGVCQWAANHSAVNWHKHDEFLPERWLEDATSDSSPFKNDQRESSQPFSLGPRNCLGKSLAELKIRLTYAKLLLNFDFELEPGQEDWITKQTQSILWEKGPLMLKFKEVGR